MRLSILRSAAPSRPITPPILMEDNVVPHPDYPVNAMGQPEFASVILTMDHMLERDSFHCSQKAVYSTERPDEALVSLFDYYREEELIRRSITREILLDLRNEPNATMAAYVVPAWKVAALAAERLDLNIVANNPGAVQKAENNIVQVILSQQLLSRLTHHKDFGNGSSLMAMNNLVNFLGDNLAGMPESRLVAYKFDQFNEANQEVKLDPEYDPKN